MSDIPAPVVYPVDTESELPREPITVPVAGYANNRWGIVMLILTEATFFAAMIASYYYLRAQSPTWPPFGISKPDVLLPAVGAAVLVISSFTMFWGENSIRNGKRERLAPSLIVSFILGAIFMVIQIYEFTQVDFSPNGNIYGSLFFTIEGFHAAHVVVGLILILSTLIATLLGHFSKERHAAVQNVNLYWHFVDALWLFLIFPTMHLSPYVY
jgi:heme/copper-type cytochrome/quinol oxidase subunit 3